MNNSLAAESGLDAKQRLIKAGLEIFGTFNLEGATTRQLADRAGVNRAAIPYYFGGKEGLYLAVIEHVVNHKASCVRPVLLRISDEVHKERLTPKEAVDQIKTLFSVYLQILLEDNAATTWTESSCENKCSPRRRSTSFMSAGCAMSTRFSQLSWQSF
jgi:TetR/AcrR family transcriptional regulator, regulator of cefoperazone and chloramphenicol sensitivity